MSSKSLRIGWAETDITPIKLPVCIAGQFPARVSERVDDPLKATVCVLDAGDQYVAFITCDLVTTPDGLRDQVRAKISGKMPALDASFVILNATHTHTAPEVRGYSPAAGHTSSRGSGIDLGVVSVEAYLDFASDRLAEAFVQAWGARKPGSVAFGLDYAVVGRNRRWVDVDGKATMYGLNESSADRFRHIEGYEDHSLNLLAAYDDQGALTGIVVNVPCPSQETGSGFALSADYWYETRAELRKRFGENLFILPQVSAAGELTPFILYEKKANNRMFELRNHSARQEIATRIADAVGRILPCIHGTRETAPLLRHRVETLDLPLARLTAADAEEARREAEALRLVYECEKAKLEADPSLRDQPRWYVPATKAFRRMAWYLGVVERYNSQESDATRAAEVHVIRLGEIAFASNPFEYYVDFGVQVKLRSPAIQTFLVQLAGGGTYVPSPRSVLGGGYGSMPASNPIGPEGGQVLADRTVGMLRGVFED